MDSVFGASMEEHLTDVSSLGQIKHIARQDSVLDGRLHLPPLVAESKELRLLTLLPGGVDDDLECLLRVADLEAASVPYETISYVWGDPDLRSFIRVEGAEVSVPASAAAALRRVRSRHVSRVVWLGAVCINQNDDDERSQQVSMMGDIYRHGIRNLIYPGEHNIVQALRSVQAILGEIRDGQHSLKDIRNEAGTWQYADVGIKTAYDVAALVDLFRIPWFR